MKSCSLCTMPPLDARVSGLMNLYQRCKERSSLPCAGGVLDQPEHIMRDFDVIDERVAVLRRKKAEDEEREQELDRIRRAQNGR